MDKMLFIDVVQLELEAVLLLIILLQQALVNSASFAIAETASEFFLGFPSKYNSLLYKLHLESGLCFFSSSWYSKVL